MLRRAKHGLGFICWAAAQRCGDELITMALLDTRAAPRGEYLKRRWSGGESAGPPEHPQFNFHAIYISPFQERGKKLISA